MNDMVSIRKMRPGVDAEPGVLGSDTPDEAAARGADSGDVFRGGNPVSVAAGIRTPAAVEASLAVNGFQKSIRKSASTVFFRAPPELRNTR